jgi:hypothetical protein
MTMRAVTRGAWLGSLALLLAVGCSIADDEMGLGDEPGADEMDPQSPPEAGSDEPGDTGETGTADDETGEEVGDLEQGLTAGMRVTFEGYPVAQLGSPWQVAWTPNTRAVVERTSNHGNVFLLEGDPIQWQYLVARLPISVSSDLSASVDIQPTSGASFVLLFYGTGVSNYKRRIKLEREPGSDHLIANTPPSGRTDCGRLPAGKWTRVTLVVHTGTTPSTFDVLLDGQASACTGVRAYATRPFSMIEFSDSSTDRWGGDVRFDNISLARP